MTNKNRKMRQQRMQRNLEKQVEEYQENDGPSGGQFYVFNLDTKEKTSGLSHRKAMALWRTLPRSVVFPEKHQCTQT